MNQASGPSGSGYTNLIGAAYSTCAVDSNGSPACWGNDAYGQVSGTPTIEKVVSLSAGYGHFCALDESGDVSCWGMNNDNLVSDTPKGSFITIKSSYNNNCAVSILNNIVCWGQISEFYFDL
jgi:hypothetical protein